MIELEMLDNLWGLYEELENESFLLMLCDECGEELLCVDPGIRRSSRSSLIWRLDRHIHELGELLDEVLKTGGEPPEAIT